MEEPNYFNNIISNKEYFYEMPDCISECKDYKDLIQQSMNLTNGQLSLETFECVDQEKTYQLNLKINSKENSISVKKISDYVDADGLIIGLNSILKSSSMKTEKKFIQLVGGPVDFGVALVTSEKEMELAKGGLIWRNDLFYKEYEQMQSQPPKSADTNIVKEQKVTKPWWKIW